MTLFHYFTKQVPFTDVDRNMLAIVCLFLACKVDFNQYPMAGFMRYFHENKRGPKKRKAYEEVQEVLLNEFTDLELKVLKVVQFEFDFELPYGYLRGFRETYILGENGVIADF
jgi:Cyclin, N-terminal domain